MILVKQMGFQQKTNNILMNLYSEDGKLWQITVDFDREIEVFVTLNGEYEDSFHMMYKENPAQLFNFLDTYKEKGSDLH
jgi:hypothetical protein